MAWDPLRDLLSTQERLESLFGRANGWTPLADLYETADRFVLTVEIPGLARQDVQIEIHDDTLTLRGARPGIACPERFHQLERGHGQFARSFRFSHAVDADGITADLADGVLTISIPKTTAPDARRVAVR